jgi:hypothetical protein
MVGCGKKTVEPEQKTAVLSEENQKWQPPVLSQEEQKKQQKATAEIKKLGGMVRGGEPDISLTKSGITDADLVYLKGLTNLRSLNLTNTKVTDEGVEILQKELPNCKIER